MCKLRDVAWPTFTDLYSFPTEKYLNNYLSYPSEDNIANPYIVYNTEPMWGGGGDIKVSFFCVLRVKPNIIFICENILQYGVDVGW